MSVLQRPDFLDDDDDVAGGGPPTKKARSRALPGKSARRSSSAPLFLTIGAGVALMAFAFGPEQDRAPRSEALALAKPLPQDRAQTKTWRQVFSHYGIWNPPVRDCILRINGVKATQLDDPVPQQIQLPDARSADFTQGCGMFSLPEN